MFKVLQAKQKNQQENGRNKVICIISYNAILSDSLARLINCMPCHPQNSSVEEMVRQVFKDEHGMPRVHFAVFQEVGDTEGWSYLKKLLKRYYPNQSLQTYDLGVISSLGYQFRTERIQYFPKTLDFYPFSTMVIHFDEHMISILNVHISAESQKWETRRQDLLVVKQRLQNLVHRFPHHGIILTGDFNTHLTSEHFPTLVKILDVPMDQPIDKENSFYLGGHDKYATHDPASVRGDTMDSSRLDYLWVFSSTDRNVRLTKLSERILREVRASDHKPLLSYVKIEYHLS